LHNPPPGRALHRRDQPRRLPPYREWPPGALAYLPEKAGDRRRSARETGQQSRLLILRSERQPGYDASTASRPASKPKSAAKFLRAFTHRHQPDSTSSINRQPAAVVADVDAEGVTPRAVLCRTAWRRRLLHGKSHRARRRLGVADHVCERLLRNPKGSYLHGRCQHWQALRCFELYRQPGRAAVLGLLTNRVY